MGALSVFEPASFAVFLAAALAVAFAPGPGLMYVLARTLSGGRADGVSSSLGTGVGGLVHVVASAIGVSALIMASAELFLLMKLAGAAYLVWLGVKTIWNAGRLMPLAHMKSQSDEIGAGASRAFRDGIIVEVFNPKTALFFLAFLPQFVDPAAGQVVLQLVLLGVIAVTLNTAADLAIAYCAGYLRSAVLERPRVLQRIGEASGGAMIALGASLAINQKHV